VEYTNLDLYRIVFWSGNLDDTRMLLHTYRKKTSLEPFQFHRLDDTVINSDLEDHNNRSML